MEMYTGSNFYLVEKIVDNSVDEVENFLIFS